MQGDKPVPGPYTQEARENWLRKLLSAQTWIRRNGPANVRNMELVSLDELQEIRRLWVVEKHEMEDSLPRIYAEATGEPYPGQRFDDNLVLGEAEMQVLREVCSDDRLHYELTRELLSVERQQRAHARRAGLFDQLEKSIRRHYYDDAKDATDMARRHAEARAAAGEGKRTVAFTEDAGDPEACENQSNLLP
jgi:DNA sulfur modification protein DndC